MTRILARSFRLVVALAFAALLNAGLAGCSEQKCCGPDCQKACCKDKTAQCPPGCTKPCCAKS